MFGCEATNTHPAAKHAQATATPHQRNRHALRSSLTMRETKSRMVCFASSPRERSSRVSTGTSTGWHLEHGLGNDQHVAGLHENVLVDVAALHQIVEPHANLASLAVDRAHDPGSVARRELGEPPRLDHDVEQRHPVAVGNRARLHRLAKHPDLSTEAADEILNDDIDLRGADVFGEPGLD